MIPISDMAGSSPEPADCQCPVHPGQHLRLRGLRARGAERVALDRLMQAAGVVPSELLTGRDLPPFAPLGNIYLTLFTSMFLHGSLLHLGGNMLYPLGLRRQRRGYRWGTSPTSRHYLLCGVVAGLVHVLVNAGSAVPSIGASGAIAGVLGGYLLRSPHARSARCSSSGRSSCFLASRPSS